METNLPFVSVCTPTFNRRPFIPVMLDMFRNQTYPKSRLEWIIVDDGTDKVRDLIAVSGIVQIKYYEIPEKLSLGAKRNLMHAYCSPRTDIILYMDDDDYYPPERISHAVETLMRHPEAMCVGSSEIYIVFRGINSSSHPDELILYQSGPMGATHATAATLAFRKELLQSQRFNNLKALAEESDFLDNYRVPMAQLDPLKTILVFAHSQNTFDKRILLRQPISATFKPSSRTIRDFIRRKDEQPIYDFFVHKLPALLEMYSPGNPENKPDVMVQVKDILHNHAQLNQRPSPQPPQSPQLFLRDSEGNDRPATLEECVQIIISQKRELDFLRAKCAELSLHRKEQ